MKKIKSLVSFDGMAWFTVMLVGTALLLTLLVVPGINDADRPAWVQALGSIAAIVVAILVMNTQHREVQRREKSAAMQIILLTHELASNAEFAIQEIDRLRSAEGRTESLSDRQRHHAKLTHIYEALLSIPLHIYPSGTSMRNALMVREHAFIALGKIHDGPPSNKLISCSPEYGCLLRPSWNTIREAKELLRDELNGGSGGPPW